MTSSFTVAEEFPDYPLADLPQIPEGFEDASWHNDVCPSFVSDPIGLTLWVDYKDPDRREHPETPRFSLQSQKDGIETSEFWMHSDNWDEILAAIEKRRLERNPPKLETGARYRLKRDVERYPFFIAKAGLTGAIESDDGEAVYLKLDAPLEGAEEWDNCLQWMRLDGDNPLDDIEPWPPIDPTTGRPANFRRENGDWVTIAEGD